MHDTFGPTKTPDSERPSWMSRFVITLLRIMLINLNYECDYVFDKILSAIYMNICGFEFLSIYRRNICSTYCYKLKTDGLIGHRNRN